MASATSDQMVTFPTTQHTAAGHNY